MEYLGIIKELGLGAFGLYFMYRLLNTHLKDVRNDMSTMMHTLQDVIVQDRNNYISIKKDLEEIKKKG